MTTVPGGEGYVRGARRLTLAEQRGGQQLQRDGHLLTTAAEVRPLLVPTVERFTQIELPVFKRLRVV